MLTDLIPALVLVVCTDGYHCSINRPQSRQVLAQPSFELCLENLKSIPAQPTVLDEEQQFATTAACAMVSPEEITR